MVAHTPICVIVMALPVPDQASRRLLYLSIGVFFVGGFLSSMLSLLVPRMTLIIGFNYGQALLVQFAFHMSYLIFAFPIARFVMANGYMRSTATGLGIMAMSCTLLLPVMDRQIFALILLVLLTLSAGATFLQIAGNTMVTVIGEEKNAVFRLNLLQGCNSLGTVLGPLFSARYMLGSQADAIARPFLFAIILMTLLAGAFFVQRDLLKEAPVARKKRTAPFPWNAMLVDKRLMMGVGAIFAYVGAEVTIGALLTNFLMEPRTLAAPPVIAGQLVSLYWGGAMLGRIGGAFVARKFSPVLLLGGAAFGGAALTLLAIIVDGPVAAMALIAVGLCNAIMYPTIYALALPRAPALATPGAMLLCMAVAGGAIIPALTGRLADAIGLVLSLTLPVLCYGLIGLFAVKMHRNQPL